VARSNDILKKLVLEAKRDCEKDAEHRVHIFLADTCGNSILNPFVVILLTLEIHLGLMVLGDGMALARSVL
jgi:hypothetical protein